MLSSGTNRVVLQARGLIIDLSESHFHLDNCGALPYMTEVAGYNGPLYMTYPTKAICPLLLVCLEVFLSIIVRLDYLGRFS